MWREDNLLKPVLTGNSIFSHLSLDCHTFCSKERDRHPKTSSSQGLCGCSVILRPERGGNVAALSLPAQLFPALLHSLSVLYFSPSAPSGPTSTGCLAPGCRGSSARIWASNLAHWCCSGATSHQPPLPARGSQTTPPGG